MSFRTCGLPHEDPAIEHGLAQLVGIDLADPPPPPSNTEWEMCGGHRVVWTDGASRHNQDARLRRSGSGLYWGQDHPWNSSFPVVGQEQGNNRAELRAVLRAFFWSDAPVEVRTDSQFVLDGVVALLAGRGVERNAEHADL
jgi:hypothetical protein